MLGRYTVSDFLFIFQAFRKCFTSICTTKWLTTLLCFRGGRRERERGRNHFGVKCLCVCGRSNYEKVTESPECNELHFTVIKADCIFMTRVALSPSNNSMTSLSKFSLIFILKQSSNDEHRQRAFRKANLINNFASVFLYIFTKFHALDANNERSNLMKYSQVSSWDIGCTIPSGRYACIKGALCTRRAHNFVVILKNDVTACVRVVSVTLSQGKDMQAKWHE